MPLPLNTPPASYYRARYYDPQIGRFLSEDPVGFYGGSNFYLYDDNDSVDFTDPWGLFPDDYNLDLRNHGAPHIDRVDRHGKLVGRYRPDGSGIPHKGKLPPRIPNSDQEKFAKAADELRRRTQNQQCESTPAPLPAPVPKPNRSRFAPWEVPNPHCIPGLGCYLGEDGYYHNGNGVPGVPPLLPTPGVPLPNPTLPTVPFRLPPLPISEPIFAW